MTGIKISIVIPAYNEKRQIVQTIKKIVQYFEEEEIKAEIIVVNDGSTDFTANLINNLAVMYSYVHPIHLSANRGKGAAVRAGVLEASGEYILFSDADLSTPIEEVTKLLTHLFGGYDIAIGYVKENALLASNPEEAQTVIESLVKGEEVKIRYYTWPDYEKHDFKIQNINFAFIYGKAMKHFLWKDFGISPKLLDKNLFLWYYIRNLLYSYKLIKEMQK